jgi:hypothetical protein
VDEAAVPEVTEADDCETAVAEVLGGDTAAAAAAAYLTGGNCVGGRVVVGVIAGRPALRILDIGCWAKFGFGGGFDAASIEALRRDIGAFFSIGLSSRLLLSSS